MTMRAVRWGSALAIGWAMAYDPILLGLKYMGLSRLMREHPEMFDPQKALESVLAVTAEVMADFDTTFSGAAPAIAQPGPEFGTEKAPRL